MKVNTTCQNTTNRLEHSSSLDKKTYKKYLATYSLEYLRHAYDTYLEQTEWINSNHKLFAPQNLQWANKIFYIQNHPTLRNISNLIRINKNPTYSLYLMFHKALTIILNQFRPFPPFTLTTCQQICLHPYLSIK